MATGFEEAIEGSLPLLKVSQETLCPIRQRHIASMATVDRLACPQNSDRSMRGEPQPHFHIPGMRQFTAISTHLFL
jgi:hypothetical protein